MEVLDYSIIAFYFAIILWIARWASKGKEDKEFSSVDYFLVGKDQSWVVIGTSLFASNIGSEIILGICYTHQYIVQRALSAKGISNARITENALYLKNNFTAIGDIFKIASIGTHQSFIKIITHES